MTIVNYKGIEIQCSNMRFSNSTLIVTPEYKGRRISFVVNNRQCANDIDIFDSLKDDILNIVETKYQKLIKSSALCSV